ncbi:toxic protein SymE [Pararobbsia alpina]|uniref:SymE family type I addiction module toxin n=1 Tax=Pararobbsia alpina TaxID=621374 RepID=UPI0039A421E4
MRNDAYTEFETNPQPKAQMRRGRVGSFRAGESPMIKLQAKWLRAAGFDTGTDFVIHVTQGMLVLVSASTISSSNEKIERPPLATEALMRGRSAKRSR